MIYTPLDLIADGTKLLIDNSSMLQNQKEYLRLGVECAAELIKQFNVPPRVNFSVMGFSLDQIYALKVAAKEFKLAKVILFPCPVNGVIIPCLKMEGGDIPAFYNAMGLSSLENMNMKVNANEGEQNELIRQYGVAIYSGDI